jgi:hypothetical protein
MANTKNSDEENQLARGILADTSKPQCTLLPLPETIAEGGVVVLQATINPPSSPIGFAWHVDAGVLECGSNECETTSDKLRWYTKGLRSGSYEARVTVKFDSPVTLEDSTRITVLPRQVEASVTLQRSAAAPTNDQALWVAIRNRTDAISFDRYNEFINRLLCPTDPCAPGAFTDEGRATCDPCASDKQARDYGGTSIGAIRDNLIIRPNIYGPDAYYLLKLAAQAFLIFESGIVIDHRRNPDTGRPTDDQPVPGLEDPESRLGRSVTFDQIRQVLETYLGTVGGNGKLPYLQRIVNALIPAAGARDETLPYCGEILQHRFSCPSLLELIWSYWEEEGMLVQTLNAISRRFQNRGSGFRDPLANLELDPLRPLNNLLWGFIQDEYNRLTVPRRAYEYDHHYGLTLVGKAVPKLESADSRSKFIEAFHNLLNRAAIFFRADSDTTVVADAFPLLNALKEVHLILAEGAHNQFGDLPWTARAEMLNMQWFLSRTEIREFLRGRHMVPYQEPWMGAVDDMKRLQGWTDTTVTHFHELAVTGERILLSVRYGDWVDLNNIEDQAKNWARFWKPEIQRYIHAYQTVTGVDLGVEVTDTRRATERYLQPSVHLQRRLGARRATERYLQPSVHPQRRLGAQPARGALPAPGAARGALASKSLEYEVPGFRRRRLPRYTEDE